jgi:uncharacterized protein (DUF488 family)
MQTTRQRYLYHFLQTTRHCSKIKLAKIFFLTTHENKTNNQYKLYGFVPYKFGPYSFELFHDVDRMDKEHLITTDDTHIHFRDDAALIRNNTPPEYITQQFTHLSRKSDSELISYVYDRYPEYTIFSEIEKKIPYQKDRTGITTIGYEGASIDEFLMTLTRDKIQVLVDVRNNPWSMKYGFTKHTLQSLCEKMNIRYLGIPALGIPGNLRKNLTTKDDYKHLFMTYATYLKTQEENLTKLIALSKNQRIALMCFEKDPQYCHRHILAEQLNVLGAEVNLH